MVCFGGRGRTIDANVYVEDSEVLGGFINAGFVVDVVKGFGFDGAEKPV